MTQPVTSLDDSARQTGDVSSRWQRARVVALVVVAGAVAVAVSLVLTRSDEPVAAPVEVTVVFGESDGLPDVIRPGETYEARFAIEWEGPVALRDGRVRVYASRLGNTTEDAPEDGWPLVCLSAFDDVVGRALLNCPFESPAPGEFALQLQVRNDDDEVIGETIYVHLIVDPTATTAPD